MGHLSSLTYHIRTPGKLFIAGEYAVLEPGHRTIVVAVNRFMKVTINESKQNWLSLPQLGIDYVTWNASDEEVTFNVTNEKLSFVGNTLKIFNRYLCELSMEQKPLSLTITSELDDQSGRKYGLGSSAAIVVAVTTALNAIYQLKLSQNEIFKLSAIVHYITQGNGSCADIAASTYGGWTCYSAFDPAWLIRELNNRVSLQELLDKQWPYLELESILPPSSLKLCVGWTKQEARTSSMIEWIQQLKVTNPKRYERFLQSSAQAMELIIDGFKQNIEVAAIKGLQLNRNALRTLGKDAGVLVETPQLEKLIEIANQFGAGKTSGAGGGDCGIAFVQGETLVDPLQQKWVESSIMPLDLQVTKTGAIAQPSFK